MSRYGNRALDGAYRKGKEAYLRGDPASSNPYMKGDTSITGRGSQRHARLNWRRAFANVWRDGWADAEAERTDEC